MKTLIITVGTRQVGWRCKDGIVRSLGADGVKYDPPHIEDLYRDELKVERGSHQAEGSDGQRPALGHRTFPWSVWDLGQRFYHLCQQTDFGNVELLLDQAIINHYLFQGLSHVFLWGTQQPETVSWNYRRMDTAWLAELMAGKLRQMHPELAVTVFRPTVGAVDAEAVRDQLEQHLLPQALATRQPKDEDFTLLIENKGATPVVAEGLSICAGALVRDCQVVTVTPNEPRPLYPNVSDTVKAVAPAEDFRPINLSSYFWPLERERILSAWLRGDFAEAKVWLSAHRDRYQVMYDVADNLALASNWQMREALAQLQDLLATRRCKQAIDASLRKQWLKAIEALNKSEQKQTPDSRYLNIWESRLLIEVNLKRQNYTSAFLQLVQTVERLLFWRYRYEDWISAGYVTPPDEKKNWGAKNYKATFWDLRQGWQLEQELPADASVVKQLEQMNNSRNDIVHRNASIAPAEFAEMIALDGSELTPEALYQGVEVFLQQFCPPDRPMPERSLLQELYQWGIEQLQT